MSWSIFIVVMVGLVFLLMLAFMIYEAGGADAWKQMAEREREINLKLLVCKTTEQGAP